jgi:hypothetical protein
MFFQELKRLCSRSLLILCSMAVGACGFIGDEPVQNNDIYQNSELSGGCTIKPEEFALVLEKDIKQQIDCLEKNFEQFSKYVKRERPDSIGKRELSVFVEDFFPDDASTIMDGLSLLFRVNLIFIEDQNDQISTDGMKRLFKLLSVANQQAAKINQAFKAYENKQIKIEQLKRTFVLGLSTLAQAGIDSMSHDKAAKVSIEQTIQEIGQRFSAVKFDHDQIRLAQIFKQVFIGGDRDHITCDELRDFLSRMKSMAALAFDLFYLKDYQLESTLDYARFALERVDQFFENIPLARDNLILSHKDLSFLVSKAKESIDPSLIEATAYSAKLHLLSPEQREEGLNAQDFKLLKAYAKAYLHSFITWKDLLHEIEIQNTPSHEMFQTTLSQWSIKMNQFIDPAIFPKEVSLGLFLEEFSENWNLQTADIQFARTIMLFKPLLIGGKAEVLNPLELERLLPKLKDSALLTLDTLIFMKKEQGQRAWFEFSLDILKRLEQLFYVGDDFEIAFLTKGLHHLKFAIPPEQHALFEGIAAGFPSIKSKLFGGHPEAVLFKEFRALFEQVLSLVENAYLSEITLDLYENELKRPYLVKNLVYKPHHLYRDFEQQRLIQFRQDFRYIFAKFHYFLDDENLQTYQSSIVRTRSGFTFNLLLRQIAQLVLSRYGHLEDGQAMLSLEEIDSMMKQFRPLLEPLGLWTKKIDTFARNMLLLSDLFQSRSNGNGAMDVDEAVEYISMVFVAVEIQARLMNALPSVCQNLGSKQNPSFATQCYRPQFFKLLFEQLKLGNKLPKLKQYINEASNQESLQFLRAVEGFARDIDDETIPMDKRDLVLLIGALLNIESTFVRFDQISENNVLDQNELDRAFYLYRSGIISVAQLDEDQQQYTKSIFLYMIQKMEMPKPASLFIFHNNPLRGNISAKRLNIGTLLYYLVQE